MLQPHRAAQSMLHAFITVSADDARERARASTRCHPPRALDSLGAPFCAKDNIFTQRPDDDGVEAVETYQPLQMPVSSNGSLQPAACWWARPTSRSSNVAPTPRSGWHLSAGTLGSSPTCGGSEWRLRFRGRGRTVPISSPPMTAADPASAALMAVRLYPSPGQAPMEGCVIGPFLSAVGPLTRSHRCRAFLDAVKPGQTLAARYRPRVFGLLSPGRRNTRSPPSTTFGSSKSPKELPSRWSRRAQSSRSGARAGRHGGRPPLSPIPTCRPSRPALFDLPQIKEITATPNWQQRLAPNARPGGVAGMTRPIT